MATLAIQIHQRDRKKVKALDLMRKGEKSYAEVNKTHGKNMSPFREIVKK